MIKEIKYGGFTTTPDDYSSPDGDLAGLNNMVPEDGALRPVTQPTAMAVLPDGYKVMCLHHVSKPQDNYILYDPEGGTLYALDKALVDAADPQPMTKDAVEAALVGHEIHDFDTEEVISVQPVGNTLVTLASGGLHYILWNETYKYLGQKIPDLQIGFALESKLTCFPKDKSGGGHADPAHLKHFVDSDDVKAPRVADHDAWLPPKDSGWEPPKGFLNAYTYSLEGNEQASRYVRMWTDFAFGNINRLIKENADDGKFTFPFFVRWAYELYDGSVVMHGDPVLMIPNSKYPFFAMNGKYGMDLQDVDDGNRDYRFLGRAYGFASSLEAVANNNVMAALKTEWKDVVRGVSLYISAPIYTYEQEGKVFGWTNMDDSGAWDDYYTEGHMVVGGVNRYQQWQLTDVFPVWNVASAGSSQDFDDRYFENYDAQHTMPSYIFTMPEKNKEDLLREVETGAFYKIKRFDLEDAELAQMTQSWITIGINKGTLDTLVARETMPNDYHSRDIIKADYAFAYNSRVNLSGITRTLHSPLQVYESWPRNDKAADEWTVTIEVKNVGTTNYIASTAAESGTAMPRYIFYPDRHATTAWLVCARANNSTETYKVTLTEHPHLEGAYWYGGLAGDLQQSQTSDDVPTATSGEQGEPSNVYTSDVNNPFVFPLLGINTVGTGKVIGLCSAVKALSQGQFGAFPLYAFCTDGVWAMQINDEGSYKAVQPITRDVCVDAGSITQLDDSVLFATDRGIMMLSGSNTVCISEQIDDKGATFDASTLPGLSEVIGSGMQYAPFREFLDGCRMVYDYVKQRIIVYNGNYGYAYVYSIDTKKWGMMDSEIKDTINAYPNALVVVNDGTDGKIADIDGKDDDDPLTGIQGVLVTRPLKLDYPDNLKTVRTVIQRGFFDYADTTRQVKPVRQVLFGSRDLYNWFPVWSSADQYLRGFSGTPYKYFRLALICDLKETEKLVGCTVEYYPRFTNQPR